MCSSDLRAFTLVDRSERKIRFVRQTARALGLENVEAVCGDVTALAATDGFIAFDTVVIRAVAGAAEAWRLARTSVAGGGRLLVMAHAQRGAPAGVKEGVKEEAVTADARIVARAALAIPGLQFRHELLVVERAAAAPSDSIDN